MPVNWKALIDMVAPLGATLASGEGNHGHFLAGWQHGQQIAQQERAQKQAQQQAQQAKSGQFKLDMMSKLMAIDDPFVFQQMKDAAAHGGQSMFGMDPAEWNDVSFPESKTAAKQLKELNDLLDGLAKQGHNLDDLAQSGSSIETKDGQLIPVESAIELTRRSPISATGQRVPVPKKAPPAGPAGTEDERTGALRQQIEAAMQAGDGPTADRLSTQYRNLQEAKREMGVSERKASDPRLDELNLTLKELQAEALRARANQPPAGSGAADMRAFNMEEKLAKNWQQMSQAARTVDQQYAVMQAGLKRFRQGDKNGGSQAVLVTFQKILDPTSVVRESEYARTASGQSLLNRIEGYTQRLAQGGAGMTEGELAQMVQTAGEFVTQLNAHTQGQRKRIETQAKRRKLDLGSIFDDVATGAPAPTTQQGTIRARDPQGKLHEAPAGTQLPQGWRLER